MTVTTTTHLNFRGQARAALEHYASVFGGEVNAVTYGQAQVSAEDAVADQVIFGDVRSPNGFAVMAFDVPPGRGYDAGEEAVFVVVRGDDHEEITRVSAGLADGGSVRTPLGPSAWAPLYGMVTDRFGVTWVLDAGAAQQG